MKQSPSAAGPPWWIRRDTPAYKTSAWSPSRLPSARKLSNHGHTRRQFALRQSNRPTVGFARTARWTPSALRRLGNLQPSRRFVGRAGRRSYGGRSGKFAGDSHAAAGRGNYQPRGGRIERFVQNRTETRASTCPGRHIDSEIREK